MPSAPRACTDASGYPRVAASFGGGGTPQSYMGTFPAFLVGVGAGRHGLRLGPGREVRPLRAPVRRVLAPRRSPSRPTRRSRNYLISCGSNIEASGGVVGVWRHANARVRGMKRVQVEPHLSVTGACSARMGADQAEDRSGVPVRADPRAAARDAARAARPAVPDAAHRLALSRRRRTATTCATAATRKPLVWDTPRSARCRTTRRASPRRWRPRAGRRDRDRRRRRACCADGLLDGETGVRQARSPTCKPTRPSGRRAICDVPAATIRQDRARISSSTPASARRSRSKARRCPTGRWP